jgi:homotetrameric cytidine deaminase
MSEKDHKKLIELAKQASLNSYSPYSKFAVGCCIETTDGQVFSGCNVENISFGLTICAERAAVFSAISAAGPAPELKKRSFTHPQTFLLHHVVHAAKCSRNLALTCWS